MTGGAGPAPDPASVPASVSASVPVSVLTGLPGAARAAALTKLLSGLTDDAPVSVLLEGAPADGTPEWQPPPGVHLHVLAPACLCCIGNLTLRVTLARVLRHEMPRHVVIGIADPLHRPRLFDWLAQPPWAGRLSTQDAPHAGLAL